MVHQKEIVYDVGVACRYGCYCSDDFVVVIFSYDHEFILYEGENPFKRVKHLNIEMDFCLQSVQPL